MNEIAALCFVIGPSIKLPTGSNKRRCCGNQWEIPVRQHQLFIKLESARVNDSMHLASSRPHYLVVSTGRRNTLS